MPQPEAYSEHCYAEGEREYPLVVELLKRRALTLEKQLAEKGAIIDFLLNQKVQNEIDNTRFIRKNQRFPILKIRIVRKNRRK